MYNSIYIRIYIYIYACYPKKQNDIWHSLRWWVLEESIQFQKNAACPFGVNHRGTIILFWWPLEQPATLLQKWFPKISILIFSGYTKNRSCYPKNTRYQRSVIWYSIAPNCSQLDSTEYPNQILISQTDEIPSPVLGIGQCVKTLSPCSSHQNSW